LAYLGGAILLSTIGHRFDSRYIAITMLTISSSLLLLMSVLSDPTIIMIVLTCMAACASVSWGSIIELITRFGKPSGRATSLSVASSGTAWGYSLNGLLILFVVPLLGWRSAWVLAGVAGLIILMLTIKLMRTLVRQACIDDPEPVASLSTGRLIRVIVTEHPAKMACLICFLVGAATMPFSTWLSSYLAELSYASELNGIAWTVAGLSGMAAGAISGKLADARGHAVALIVMFFLFVSGMVGFAYDPGMFVFLAGFGYGMMYFPMWGVIAAWLGQYYSSTETMQINSIGMVTFGVGGALMNFVAGLIQEATGSLELLFVIIAADALILLLLALYIYIRGKDSEQAGSPAV
ncbi:MAG: MFS transporter, partial [Amphritea sp.]|nr:MFS transporter [Amphritea sp.]